MDKILIENSQDGGENLLDSKLGEYIRTKRNERGYSLRELDKKTGITYSHLGKIERGGHIPEKQTLMTIAEALEIDKNELYLLAGYLPEELEELTKNKSNHKMFITYSTGSGKTESMINQILKYNNVIKESYLTTNYDSILKTVYDLYLDILTDEEFTGIISKHHNKLFGISEETQEKLFYLLGKRNYRLLEDNEKELFVDIFKSKEIAATKESSLTSSKDSVIEKMKLNSNNRLNEILGNQTQSMSRVNRNTEDVEFIKIPIYGEIKAGYDMLGEQNIIDYQITSKKDVADGNYFYLIVKGDSMIEDGIVEGCRVLVRKQNHVENGKVGVCIVNGEEATLKRVHYDGDKIILQAANKRIPPRTFNIGEVLIQGQVKSYVVDL